MSSLPNRDLHFKSCPSINFFVTKRFEMIQFFSSDEFRWILTRWMRINVIYIIVGKKYQRERVELHYGIVTVILRETRHGFDQHFSFGLFFFFSLEWEKKKKQLAHYKKKKKPVLVVCVSSSGRWLGPPPVFSFTPPSWPSKRKTKILLSCDGRLRAAKGLRIEPSCRH